jgi:NADH-quinone oxidoreductase subunit D
MSSSRITIPIGPQHPALKEPLSFMLTVEGEQVVDSALRLGYVHRGLERICQQRSYIQNVHVVERVCGICSHIHSSTYCQAVETLLELEVPPRALYLRALLCELERIHSHLLWLGVLAEGLGFTTIFMYTWRDREIVLDIMEELSGGRVAHAANIVGGMSVDVDEDHIDAILQQLDSLEPQLSRFVDLVHNERSFRGRTRGVGLLPTEIARDHCTVGPTARGSGIDVDVRRDTPYGVYDQLSFSVITVEDGDVWARTAVRTQETMESLDLCRQLLQGIPKGPIKTRAPRRVPPGEVVSRGEAPRGEVVYYMRSDGSEQPARVKIRTPTLPALSTLPVQLQGVNTADIPVVLAGVDLCIACADR